MKGLKWILHKKRSLSSLSNRDKPKKIYGSRYVHYFTYTQRVDLMQDNDNVVKCRCFPTSWASFLPKFHIKFLTWNVGSEAALLKRHYTFNTVIRLSGWENVSWQMQRKPFMQKKHSGSQRHWKRMSKVLAVLVTYGKGTVPATGWVSAFIKFATAKGSGLLITEVL